MSKVLVTGLSGLIGGALHKHIGADDEVAAFNRSEVAGVTNFRGELDDFELVRRACDGQDMVVHLAAKAGERFTWDELLQTNVVGTRHVLQAAAEAGVKRVVLASSGATVSGWEQESPYREIVAGDYDAVPDRWPIIDVAMATRPSGVYGSTKVWAESLGRHFADTTSLEVVNLRIGYVNGEDRPNNARQFAVWCSQRDVVTMLLNCMYKAMPSRCETFFANSHNKWGYRDLTYAHQHLDFVPQDEAEYWRGR